MIVFCKHRIHLESLHIEIMVCVFHQRKDNVKIRGRFLLCCFVFIYQCKIYQVLLEGYKHNIMLLSTNKYPPVKEQRVGGKINQSVFTDLQNRFRRILKWWLFILESSHTKYVTPHTKYMFSLHLSMRIFMCKYLPISSEKPGQFLTKSAGTLNGVMCRFSPIMLRCYWC